MNFIFRYLEKKYNIQELTLTGKDPNSVYFDYGKKVVGEIFNGIVKDKKFLGIRFIHYYDNFSLCGYAPNNYYNWEQISNVSLKKWFMFFLQYHPFFKPTRMLICFIKKHV